MYKEFLEHLELREGNKECVYLDSLNKPTCGVGHLLTERERQVYKVGDKVSEGDVLCIIEAMKMMNEVKSDYNGIIKEILISDAEPVEYGEALFVIEE